MPSNLPHWCILKEEYSINVLFVTGILIQNNSLEDIKGNLILWLHVREQKENLRRVRNCRVTSIIMKYYLVTTIRILVLFIMIYFLMANEFLGLFAFFSLESFSLYLIKIFRYIKSYKIIFIFFYFKLIFVVFKLLT